MIPGLFRGLCDDAALFPPGNAPLPHAVAQHLRYARETFADMVGPFVFPATRLGELTPPSAPMHISLTVPQGVTVVSDALRLAESIEGISVVGVEVPVSDDRDVAELPAFASAVTVYVEVPRDHYAPAVLDAIRQRGHRAKFRTGGVTADAHPTEHELAQSFHGATSRGIPFKATAGLHRAVRHTATATGFEQHGYLNILLAADAAAAGATVDDLEHLLSVRDAAVIAESVSTIDGPRVFDSFGTCSIAEPYADLLDMGLLSTPSSTPRTAQ